MFIGGRESLYTMIYYIASCAVILIITGAAKLVSSAGEGAVLLTTDPVFGIKFKAFFVISGILELAIATICFSRLSERIKLTALAWLATLIATYRAGAYFADYRQPCPCLGTLTGAIGISPFIADKMMLGCAMFILVGSYGGIWHMHVQKRSA